MKAWLARCLLLLVCVLPATVWPQGYHGIGTVLSIEESRESSTSGNVIGAIGGALLGGWLGSSVGGGTGRTIATGVGAVGGALAGRSVGGNMSQQTVWYVTVRFDDGFDRRIRVEQTPSYRNGDRVRVSDNVVEPIQR